MDAVSVEVTFGMTRTFTGARDQNRTDDLRITSALLYRLSYPGNDLRCYRYVGVLMARLQAF